MTEPTLDDGARARSLPALRGARFPFNEASYAAVLPHLGDVATGVAAASSILVRSIPGTAWSDGMLPWPYARLDRPAVAALREAYPGLVSLVGVIGPASEWHDPASAEVSFLKDHFVYEPTAPIGLSTKSRRNLQRGERHWRFDLVADSSTTDGSLARRMGALYSDMAKARGLARTALDFPPLHFQRLAALPSLRAFVVTNARGDWGAFCCGCQHEREMHLVHVAASSEGRQSHATQVLMHGLTSWTLRQDLTLFIGGLPRTGSPGLERFKRRWTNRRRPSHLLRLVLRPELYARLPAASGADFFPRYRAPW